MIDRLLRMVGLVRLSEHKKTHSRLREEWQWRNDLIKENGLLKAEITGLRALRSDVITLEEHRRRVVEASEMARREEVRRFAAQRMQERRYGSQVNRTPRDNSWRDD